MNPTEYLGDGVYLEHDGYLIRLYTCDGILVTSEVYLEPEVLEAFLRVIKKWRRIERRQ